MVDEGANSRPTGAEAIRLAAQTAITELLVRNVLGNPLAEDRRRAAELLRVLDSGDDEDRVVFAASVGAVSALWNEVAHWDPDTKRASLAAARSIPSRTGPADLTTLGALAVCLMAFEGFSVTPASDAIHGAEILRSVENHDLCSWACHRALRNLDLTESERVRALILISVVDHDAGAGEEAMRLARELPDTDPGRRIAEALWPSLDFLGERRRDLELRAALAANDRPGAARAMADAIGELRSPRVDDAYLAGLHRAVLGLAGEEIEPIEVRLGMRMVIERWRDYRRTGTVPPVARAGIENVIDLLKRDLSGPSPQLLFEIVEALADHGLSSLDDRSFGGASTALADAALVQARMSASAAQEVDWPNLPWIIERLGTTNVVLTHTRRRFKDSRIEVTALHLRPPTYPALNQVSLDQGAEETLTRLAGQRLEEIEDIAERELLDLIDLILPPSLLGLLEHAPNPPAVVVVPDGPLWAVPWHAVRSARPLSIAPSMSIRASIAPPADAIRRILAFVDEDIPGSGAVGGALARLGSAGFEIFTGHSPEDLTHASDADLLLIFSHGSGHGLDYRLMLPGGPVTVLELASIRPPARVLVASCWSARMPPTSFPLSLPTALLLAGSKTVVGGLWPLPAIPTGEIVADTLGALPVEGSLAVALHSVRSSTTSSVVNKSGLGIFGAVDETPDVAK